MRGGHVKGARHRKQITFRFALCEAVFDLQSNEWAPAMDLGECVGLRYNPCRGMGDAHVEHFSCTNHIIKPAHHFLNRSHEIPSMNPVEVDVACFSRLRLASRARATNPPSNA